MARTARSVVADQIRIEDEVWEEAFASRVRSRPPRTGQPLRALGSQAPVRAHAPERAGSASAVVELRPETVAISAFDLAAGSDTDLDRASETGLAADPYPRQPGAERRMVRIQGRGAERHLPVASSRRRTRRAHESAYFRPDKLAMWAVLLGFLLVAAAMLSGHS